MTPEEAIEVLNNFFIVPGRANGKTMLRRALDTAFATLEKQIPKEPTVEIHDYCGEDYVTRKVAHEMCPGCHRVLSFGCAMSWCMYCGQKIDWSKLR